MHFCSLTDIASDEEIKWLRHLLQAEKLRVKEWETYALGGLSERDKDCKKKANKWLKLIKEAG